jgi:hypothetical protein
MISCLTVVVDVIPAKAGIQMSGAWIPAYAGMTGSAKALMCQEELLKWTSEHVTHYTEIELSSPCRFPPENELCQAVGLRRDAPVTFCFLPGYNPGRSG